MRALALLLRRLATREASQSSQHVNSSRSFSVIRSLKDFASGSSGPCATGDVYLPRLLLAQNKVSVAHVGGTAKGFDSASTHTRLSSRQLLGSLRQSFPSLPKHLLIALQHPLIALLQSQRLALGDYFPICEKRREKGVRSPL